MFYLRNFSTENSTKMLLLFGVILMKEDAGYMCLILLDLRAVFDTIDCHHDQ